MKNLLYILTFFMVAICITSCGTNKTTKVTDGEVQENFGRQLSEAMKDPMFTMNLDSIKSKYGNSFNELRTIINRHDPIGLIDLGAPEDEYESEVKTIIVQLDKEMTEKQIHDLVYTEFLRWFDDASTAGSKDAYKELSNDIYKWMKK